MAMRLLLACGCERAYAETAPICPAHGLQRVVRTLGVGAPRICGVATGPHVTPEDLAPWTARIAGSDPE
jgi:hypothetical protein